MTSSVSRPLSIERASLRLAAPTLALLLAGSAQAAPPAAAPTTLAQSAEFIGTALNVVDLDREVRFYGEAFGLKVAATLPAGTRTETILRFEGNSSQPSLLLMHDTTASAPKTLDHGNGFSRLVIRVVDIAALDVQLAQLGYAHQAVRQGGQGYRVMMLRDPEGYPIEVVQPRRPQTGN